MPSKLNLKEPTSNLRCLHTLQHTHVSSNSSVGIQRLPLCLYLSQPMACLSSRTLSTWVCLNSSLPRRIKKSRSRSSMPLCKTDSEQLQNSKSRLKVEMDLRSCSTAAIRNQTSVCSACSLCVEVQTKSSDTTKAEIYTIMTSWSQANC